MQVKFISPIQPIQMAPTKVINSISLNMQVIRIIQEPIISNVTLTSTRAIYLCFPSIFCECCHAIILIFVLSNFTLKFYLKNPAATRVSPSYINRCLPVSGVNQTCKYTILQTDVSSVLLGISSVRNHACPSELDPRPGTPVG